MKKFNLLFKGLNTARTIKNSVLNTLWYLLIEDNLGYKVRLIENYGKDVEKLKEMTEFIENLKDILENNVKEDDFSDYSVEILKMEFMLRFGYEEDYVWRMLKEVKDLVYGLRLGIIDIRKPLEAGNFYIDLIEF